MGSLDLLAENRAFIDPLLRNPTTLRPYHPTTTSTPSLTRRNTQRLVQIPQDVLNVFNADAEADEVGRDASCDQLVFGELAVGRAGWVNGQALGVTDVGDVAKELQVVDEVLACCLTALDAKAEDRARALGQYFLARS